MTSEFSLYEKAAEQALDAAEKELLKRFKPNGPVKTEYKADKELVTEADRTANKIIQSTLSTRTPDVPVLSEEGTLHEPRVIQTRLHWVLDPLDGTTNYSIGLPLWGISLALLEDGVPVRGFIRLPVLKERYEARLNEGAWQNGKRFRMKKKIRMTDGVGLLCHGYADADKLRGTQAAAKLVRHTLSTRHLGVATVECAWVATGRVSYLAIHGAKPWDLAAGTLLVTEAGGFVSRPDGKPWKIEDADCVAANPASYEAVIKLLRA